MSLVSEAKRVRQSVQDQLFMVRNTYIGGEVYACFTYCIKTDIIQDDVHISIR